MGGMSKSFPKRGEIYWLSLRSRKKLPCLVLSNDVGNEVGNRLMVAPLSKEAENVYPFEVQIQLNGKNSKVLLDQVHSVPKGCLLEKISALDEETKKLVDKALKIALSL